MQARLPWQRRELEQRVQALETLINQEAIVRVTLHRPERKRNQAALDWLRRELARTRETMGEGTP
jgi:hypothetical protein